MDEGKLDEKGAKWLRDLVAQAHGDRETVARYLAQTVTVGPIRVCRRAIAEALGDSDPEAAAKPSRLPGAGRTATRRVAVYGRGMRRAGDVGDSVTSIGAAKLAGVPVQWARAAAHGLPEAGYVWIPSRREDRR